MWSPFISRGAARRSRVLGLGRAASGRRRRGGGSSAGGGENQPLLPRPLAIQIPGHSTKDASQSQRKQPMAFPAGTFTGTLNKSTQQIGKTGEIMG